MNQPNDPWSNDQPQNNQSSNSPSPQNDELSGIGRNMTIVASIIGLALATWIFSGVEERQQNPNYSPDSYSANNQIVVTLQRNRYGHYVTSGYLNDEPVVYMLDTGATVVAIPGSLENRLNLRRGRQIQTHTANGIGTAYTTEIDYIQIGDIRLNNVRASILPGMEGEQILLGMDALKQLEFRQKGRELTLIQSR
jgi:aspartyl protease family protein